MGALCVLVVTACGSSAASSGTTTASTAATTTTAGTTTTGSSSFAAYQSCLKAHGDTLPAGGFGSGGFFRHGATGASGATGATGGAPTGATGASGPGGFRRRPLTAAQQKAEAACASLRPTGGFGGFGGGPGGAGGAASNPAFAKFETCLKNHGEHPVASAAPRPRRGLRSQPAAVFSRRAPSAAAGSVAPAAQRERPASVARHRADPSRRFRTA